jgi:hypothetical protein
LHPFRHALGSARLDGPCRVFGQRW